MVDGEEEQETSGASAVLLYRTQGRVGSTFESEGHVACRDKVDEGWGMPGGGAALTNVVNTRNYAHQPP